MALYVKCLNGDLHTLVWVNWQQARLEMARLLGCDAGEIIFVRENGQEEPSEVPWAPLAGETVFAVADPAVMLLNVTAGEYIETTGDRYERSFASLATVLQRSALDARDRGSSRWAADDRVIYVPTHLRPYVRQSYASVAL